MTIKKLMNFLDENEIKYVTVRHSNAYTAQEVASTLHVSGKGFAKTVIVNLEDKMAMCVLPASYKVDFKQLRETLRVDKVELADEAEFRYQFPDCEPGAMPPFGNLYNMDVYVAESLTSNDEIVFNAGSHTETIKMKFEDFRRLVNPKIFRFALREVSMPGDPSERWASDY